MSILVWVVFVAMIVAQIMVVIKMFQNAGVVHGILGLICGLYAYIWGWMNASKLNIRNLMIIWTVLIILFAILAGTTGAMNFDYGVGPNVTTP
ncbi:MAG: hypothetical protein LC795_09920 [Acidobacteria bacterium]|nr:hypothetical protein [Acidobacteriota bacterium]